MNPLYVTYCSATKHPIQSGNPKELYDSPRIANFIQTCETKNYEWAILSAKYGLLFPWETRNNYNVTFKTLSYKCRVVENDRTPSETMSKERIAQTVEQVKRSIAEKSIQRIVFFFEQPLQRRKCYLSILHRSLDGCGIDHETFTGLKQHLDKLAMEGKSTIRVSETI